MMRGLEHLNYGLFSLEMSQERPHCSPLAPKGGLQEGWGGDGEDTLTRSEVIRQGI